MGYDNLVSSLTGGHIDKAHRFSDWSARPLSPAQLAYAAADVTHLRGVYEKLRARLERDERLEWVAEEMAHLADPALNQQTGRALLADGLATGIAGLGGGSGTTTYGENIGVMAATKVYSTAAYWVAGAVAILLSLSPKFGALVNTIPAGVLGGVTVALYGLIGVVGVKIWIDNRVDFSQNRNLIVAAITLIVGTGDFTLRFGQFALGGIGTATFGALILWALLGRARNA